MLSANHPPVPVFIAARTFEFTADFERLDFALHRAQAKSQTATHFNSRELVVLLQQPKDGVIRRVTQQIYSVIYRVNHPIYNVISRFALVVNLSRC